MFFAAVSFHGQSFMWKHSEFRGSTNFAITVICIPKSVAFFLVWVVSIWFVYACYVIVHVISSSSCALHNFYLHADGTLLITTTDMFTVSTMHFQFSICTIYKFLAVNYCCSSILCLVIPNGMVLLWTLYHDENCRTYRQYLLTEMTKLSPWCPENCGFFSFFFSLLLVASCTFLYRLAN